MNGLPEKHIQELYDMVAPASSAGLSGQDAASLSIVIISHIHPDGDAVGSSIAMYSWLRSLGLSPRIVLPHEPPESLSFLTGAIPTGDILIHETAGQVAFEAVERCDLAICLDFNSPARIGDLEPALRGNPCRKILIDHHLGPDRETFPFGFSETEVSSTCELLYFILKSMPGIDHDAGKLPELSRTALMTGMTTDSNNFANSVFPTTLTMASELLATGVDRDMIIDRLFHSYKSSRILLLGHLLDHELTLTPEGGAYMLLTRETASRFCIREGDTEGFVNIPLGIKDVRLSIFIKEDTDRYRISLRSKKGVSANLCARLHFNGGGHELASGGRLPFAEGFNSREKVLDYVDRVLADFLGNHGFSNESK